MVVLTACLAGLVGCTDGDDAEVAEAGAPTTDATTTSTTAPEDEWETVGEPIGGDEDGDEGPPSTTEASDDGWEITPPAGSPSTDELRTALLTEADLPAGSWESGIFEGDERDEESPPLCPAGQPGNLLSDLVRGLDVGGISAGFAEGEDPTERLHSAVVAVDDAPALLDDARSQVEACAASEGTGQGEEERTYDYSLEAWDPGGDDALVFRASSDGPIPTLHGYAYGGGSTLTVAFVRVGNLVALVEHRFLSIDPNALVVPGQTAPPNPTLGDPIVTDEDLQALLALSVERLEALG